MRTAESSVNEVESFLSSARFPIAMLSTLFGVWILLVAVLLIPANPGPIGEFAEAFRVWCYGYDPATHRLEPIWVVTMLAQPLVLSGVLLVVWWRPLSEARAAGWPGVGPWMIAGFTTVLLSAAGVYAVADPLPDTEMAFPAEELRLSTAPPDWRLTDHTGAELALSDLRGKVVMMTAIYAHCASMCPQLLLEAKEAVAAVPPERAADLVVAAVTLDPARDTPERLAQLAKGYGVAAPQWRLLTGPVPEVERVLDRLDITRKVDPKTGEIVHPGIYFLIDRQGRLAWRFALGEGQKRWLMTGLGVLLAEPAPEARS